MLCCLALTLVSMASFGLSVSLNMAIATRFFVGISSGMYISLRLLLYTQLGT